MDYNLINQQYQKITETYSSHKDFKSEDSSLLLKINFSGLTKKDDFELLKAYTQFEVFVEHNGQSRELDPFISYISHPRFTSDLSDGLVTMKFSKTVLPSGIKLYFIPEDLNNYLNSQEFDEVIFSLNSPLKIYTTATKTFSTSMINFINLADVDTYEPMTSNHSNLHSNNYGHHVEDTAIPKMLLSLMMYDADLNCPIQKTIILKSYTYFLKLLAINNNQDNLFELQGKRSVKIFNNTELDPSNWESLRSLTEFLLTGGEFLEKLIIIKNVISLYLNPNSTLGQFDEKLKDMYETSQHYFNNYIQDDLESFFDLRNTLYKETINISFNLQKSNDRILNYIYGTLLGFILLIATTYLKLLEKENISFFLVIIMIFCIFSFIIYFTLLKNVDSSSTIIKNQFKFFSNKILILPIKEKDELQEKFIDAPLKKVNETLLILKSILIGLNILIVVIFLAQFTTNIFFEPVPWWLKIITYLLG